MNDLPRVQVPIAYSGLRLTWWNCIVTGTSAKADVMWSVQFVCHSVCKSNQLLSLKLGVMIGPTNWKKWLTFGGDRVPDMDSGSLFHFPHRCRIWDFWRFISSCHTVFGRFSRHSAKWLLLTK